MSVLDDEMKERRKQDEELEEIAKLQSNSKSQFYNYEEENTNEAPTWGLGGVFR